MTDRRVLLKALAALPLAVLGVPARGADGTATFDKTSQALTGYAATNANDTKEC